MSHRLLLLESCEREPTNSFDAFRVNASIYDDHMMIQALSQPCVHREATSHRKLPSPPIKMFAVPGNAIHYFCVVGPEEAGEEVTDRRGCPKCQLIDDIKEQWTHGKEQQENLQKVLADGASRHETTN
ncbi:hypothetical protein VE03_10521 [Pseudogymnoascus sp. 23342-1-I1]|nr:hypothetical protein VE03_10521 [Pseudogymnoascus sp. 23342-1-I1]